MTLDELELEEQAARGHEETVVTVVLAATALVVAILAWVVAVPWVVRWAAMR